MMIVLTRTVEACKMIISWVPNTQWW